jgi:hypothetical protein
MWLPLCHENCTASPQIHIHNPASLQLCQRRVDPQRRAQVPRACIADVIVRKAAMCTCEHWPRSLGSLSATATAPQIASTPTSQPHSSVVSVVLTCSAAPRSRAPASPILLPVRLPMCKCEHCHGGPFSATKTSTHRLIPSPHPHPQPHLSRVSVVLTRRAAPRSRAPTSPIPLPSRLPWCKHLCSMSARANQSRTPKPCSDCSLDKSPQIKSVQQIHEDLTRASSVWGRFAARARSALSNPIPPSSKTEKYQIP